MTFTGLVRAVGRASFDPKLNILYVSVAEAGFWDREEAGASIAINGCCLTLLEATTGQTAKFFIMEESRNLVNLVWAQGYREEQDVYSYGTLVNVEPAMRKGDPFGGHTVTGHIDGMQEVLSVEEKDDGSTDIWISRDMKHLILEKGSISLDGVSLTVAEVESTKFRVSIIPHTKQHTTFKDIKDGQALNVEHDQLVKLAAKLLEDTETRNALLEATRS